MAVGEVECRSKSCYFVLNLVMENHVLVLEKLRNFKVNLLCEPCFLISVCMFIVSKALLISSATRIVLAGGTIWLNPFAMVLFTVCSAVTAEWFDLYPCCVGVFGMFPVM